MRRSLALLLASTAFNTGAQAMASAMKTPDTGPLRETVERMNQAAMTGDDILKRAPDISAMVEYWDKIDVIVEGYDAIKKAGQTYLPKFADEEPNEYNVRLELTKFTNVYRDIVEALAAKPFEEEISLVGDSIPAEIQEFIENVDGAGNNLTIFAAATFFNGVNSAIDWIFVDFPIVDRTLIRTVADEKRAGIQPFWTHVLGRNVLEVRTSRINGKQELTYIRVFEPGVTEQDRVRIFERSGDVVTWQLWEKLPEKNEFVIIGDGVLSIKVIPFVPFITGRRDGSSWKFFPAMRDAADLQIKLYQAESALEYVTTMSGYPMLAANGLRPQMESDNKTPKKVRVGPAKILWGLPDNNGNHGEWKWIEPTAQNMEFLQKKIDKTKEDLRELGRQPLTATSGNLTVITTAVAAGKAKSAVAAWTFALKDTLENALVITAMYRNIAYEPEVNVYNEFDNFMDAANDVAALATARENGDISQKTYWYELKRRKVLSPEFNENEEIKRLLAEVPSDDVDLEDDDDLTGGVNNP